MPVFLSYKRDDVHTAVQIGHYLGREGIKFYLDVLDPELRTTADLTASLIESIRRCTHIMTLVSEYTRESWWVPFEVGAATEMKRRVCTFALADVQLPDFLSAWPVLRSHQDLLKFCELYKLDTNVELHGDPSRASQAGAERFHGALRSYLAQA